MKPYAHAKNSAKKYGGQWLDYMPIHELFDSSKASIADMRHRALFHSSFGIFVVEKVLGTVLRNSDGVNYNVRDIGEDHVIEDIGFIPSVDKWLRNMRLEDWMLGAMRGGVSTRFIPMKDGE